MTANFQEIKGSLDRFIVSNLVWLAFVLAFPLLHHRNNLLITHSHQASEKYTLLYISFFSSKNPKFTWLLTFICCCICSISRFVSGSFIIFGSTVIKSSGKTIMIIIGFISMSLIFHSSLCWKYLNRPGLLSLNGYGNWLTWDGWTLFTLRALTFPLELTSTLTGS